MDQPIIAIRRFNKAVENAAKSFAVFYKQFKYFKKNRTGRWTMMAKNGQNKKTRLRNQTMLKGRGCRTHKGGYPLRGKGRTAHGRR